MHYDIKTLTVADSAMRKAIKTAEELDIPLMITGDIHETKANLRGECTNAMIETFQQARCEINLIIGNHDKINEKSKEHSLNFLAPHCNFIITEPRKFSFEGFFFYLIPYYHDVTELRTYLKTLPKGSTLIMHQGLRGSNAGEYFNDRTALSKEDVEDFRVISGHYHCRQDIQTGKLRPGAVGLWSFIGNPFTKDFNECNDPEKGYQILFDDGTLEFVSSHERKHVKIKMSIDDLKKIDITKKDSPIDKGDIVWIVVEGSSDKLTAVTKESLGLPQPFRLELVSTDDLTPGEAPKKLDFDSVIDSASIETERKPRLKDLWKGLISEDSASQGN